MICEIPRRPPTSVRYIGANACCIRRYAAMDMQRGGRNAATTSTPTSFHSDR